VTVRPDGKVSAFAQRSAGRGLTPDELRDSIAAAARKYVEDPNPKVIVKEDQSRKVFITGQVEKAGRIPERLDHHPSLIATAAAAGNSRTARTSRSCARERQADGVMSSTIRMF